VARTRKPALGSPFGAFYLRCASGKPIVFVAGGTDFVETEERL
jgi:NAD(P)H-flavin reductase